MEELTALAKRVPPSFTKATAAQLNRIVGNFVLLTPLPKTPGEFYDAVLALYYTAVACAHLEGKLTIADLSDEENPNQTVFSFFEEDAEETPIKGALPSPGAGLYL